MAKFQFLSLKAIRTALGALGIVFAITACETGSSGPGEGNTDQPPTTDGTEIGVDDLGFLGDGVENDIAGPAAFYVTDLGNVLILDQLKERLVYQKADGTGRRVFPLQDVLPDGVSGTARDLAVVEDSIFVLVDDEPALLSLSLETLEPSPARTLGTQPRLRDATAEAEAMRAFRRSGHLPAENRSRTLSRPGASPCDAAGWDEIWRQPWQDVRIAAGSSVRVTARFARPDPQTLTIAFTRSDQDETLTSTPLAVEGLVASAYLVGSDRDGQFYVLVEAVTQDGTDDMGVSVWVVRYGADGAANAVYPVRFSKSALPQRYVNVNGLGAVYALSRVSGGQAFFRKLTAQPVDVGRPLSRSLSAEADDDTDLRDSLLLLEQFTESGVTQDPVRNRTLSGGRASITRREIIALAEDYVTAEWSLSDTAYNPPPDHDALCSKQGGSAWRRPNYLNGRQGEVVRSIPYKWGGWDTIASFRSRPDVTAGDVCTCRNQPDLSNCVLRKTRGVDCSGFVTRVWDVETRFKFGTSTLSRISTDVAWTELKCGDILNRPGRHVRLFSRFTPAFGGRVEFYEASLICGGVCRRTVPFAMMDLYLAARYDRLAEEPDSRL